MIDDLLRQAVAAIKSGDKSRGKQLLIQILEQDSRNEIAWLWLSQCVQIDKQKLDCLTHVLEIDPNNITAQKELARLQTLSQIKAQTVQPVPPQKKGQPKQTVPSQKKTRSFRLLPYILIAAVVMACIGVIAIGVMLGGGGDGGSEGATASRASIMCQDLVENQLVAPSTAKWPSLYEITVQKFQSPPDAYRVIGFVDAQNSFGALIRTYYTCEIAYKGGDWTDMRNWDLGKLEFDN